ncbi:hypothetical protein [Paenibacillus sp. FSL R10-2736]|uniref:hypothetical protein n=1 Tax=Paenibacillus sp. FSL R10-2736 TaxID=2954692 RepID=UPI0030F92E23
MIHNRQIPERAVLLPACRVSVICRAALLAVTYEAVFKESLGALEFMLDSSYTIHLLCADDEEIDYERTGTQVRITALRLFKKITVSYSKRQGDNSFRLLPGSIHFPSITPGLKNNAHLFIESDLSFVTNAEKICGEYTIKDLSCLVIADCSAHNERKLNIEISGRSVAVSKPTLSLFERVDLAGELSLFLDFYYSLFKRRLECRIVDIVDLQVNAISCKNLILVDGCMAAKPLVFLYKYLFHEIIHQELGLTTVFVGRGRHWLLESFTEYLQLCYLKNRFGEAFFDRQLQYYKHLFEANIAGTDTTIAEFEPHMDEQTFLALICGKGVLAFNELFQSKNMDMTILKQLIELFDNCGRVVSLDLFIELLEQCTGMELSGFVSEWIGSIDRRE